MTKIQSHGFIVFFDEDGSVEGFSQVLRGADQQQGVESLVCLSCDSNGFTPESVDEILQRVNKPLIGGVFPRIILDGVVHTKGTIILGLPFKLELEVLGGEQPTCGSPLQASSPNDFNLAFIFVDSISPNNLHYIQQAYDCLGTGIKVIGGGAGSLDFRPRPCLFSKRGLIADACIVGVANAPSGVAITHGWHAFSRYLEVTETEGKNIISLDWKPARKVYFKIVEDSIGRHLDEVNFFDQAKGHPLGIISLGNEMIVRDLIGLDGNCLVGLNEIPPRTMVCVMKGDEKTLLSSAQECHDTALIKLGGVPPCVGFVMDCISRSLFLGDLTAKELLALRIEGVLQVGAFTIGEIASDGESPVELHNKTTAYALLGAET